jgi:hypothetical protein
MQAQAESVEAALDSVAKAPLIICRKNGETLGAATSHHDIRWDEHVHAQGITHNPGDSTFIVSEDGVYSVNARVAFSGADTTGTIKIAVNGIILEETREDEAGTSTAWPKPRISHYVKLNAGDALLIYGYANLPNVNVSSESSFQMAKIAGF